MDLHQAFILFCTAVVIALVVALLMAFPVMWLWNGVIVGLFGLPVIGFTQALGLNILCGILFRSPTNNNN